VAPAPTAKLLAVSKEALEVTSKTPTTNLGNNVGLPLQFRTSLHGSNVDGSSMVDATTTNPATTTTLPHGHRAVMVAETTDTARTTEIILPQEPPQEPPLEVPRHGNNKHPLHLLVARPAMATVTPHSLRHLQLAVMVLLLGFLALLLASSPCTTAALLLLPHLPLAKALLLL
jgi:hypothetical protein